MPKNEPSRYRSRKDIDYDILRCARNPIKFTHIVYKAAFNSTLARAYLKSLIERGLLEETSSSSKKLYKTTPLGFSYITYFSAMASFIGEVND